LHQAYHKAAMLGPLVEELDSIAFMATPVARAPWHSFAQPGMRRPRASGRLHPPVAILLLFVVSFRFFKFKTSGYGPLVDDNRFGIRQVLQLRIDGACTTCIATLLSKSLALVQAFSRSLTLSFS